MRRLDLLSLSGGGHNKTHRGARKRHVRILEHGNTPQNAIQNFLLYLFEYSVQQKMFMPRAEAGPSVAWAS